MAGSADHPLFPDDSLEKGCRGIEEALRGIERHRGGRQSEIPKNPGIGFFFKSQGRDFKEIPGSYWSLNY